MKPVEIEIRVGVDGALTPLRLRWDGAWLKIAQISRAWSDDSGDHWLLMATAPPRIFELRRTPEGLWQARSMGATLSVA